MTFPKYKIEVWEPGGGSAFYTITDKATLYFKELLTKQVGFFSFSVPTKKNGSYEYNDIDLYDTVKMWVGYDSVSGNPNFVGKILSISGPLSVQSGFVRIIKGLSQGEVLLRRIKTAKWYENTAVSTIVTDLANDLSLGTSKIESDSTQINLNINAKRYFDLLTFVSDYWVNASTKIQKDFYVDYANDLVWASRPFRTSGVETVTVGENILRYVVNQSLQPVKNAIAVYGEQQKTNPSDKDSWTEGTSNWTSVYTLGTSADRKAGSYSVTCSTNGSPSTWIRAQRNFSATDCDRWKKYTKLKFWYKFSLGGSQNPLYLIVRLYSSGSGNYFSKMFSYPTDLTEPGIWNQYAIDLGEGRGWSETGSPDWSDIVSFWYEMDWSLSAECTVKVDELHFGDAYYVGSASDATSQTNYGTRDLEVVDTKLTSDSDCSKRAESLLMQMKDPPTEITLTVVGNTNILVGDQLPTTIPAENISAQNYDVFSVAHSISDSGFLTEVTMMDSANVRRKLPLEPMTKIMDIQETINELVIDEKTVG